MATPLPTTPRAPPRTLGYPPTGIPETPTRAVCLPWVGTLCIHTFQGRYIRSLTGPIARPYSELNVCATGFVHCVTDVTRNKNAPPPLRGAYHALAGSHIRKTTRGRMQVTSPSLVISIYLHRIFMEWNAHARNVVAWNSPRPHVGGQAVQYLRTSVVVFPRKHSSNQLSTVGPLYV